MRCYLANACCNILSMTECDQADSLCSRLAVAQACPSQHRIEHDLCFTSRIVAAHGSLDFVHICAHALMCILWNWNARRKDREDSVRLEALAVDDGRTALIVFLLGDPHLLECRERGKDGTTDPDGVFALGRSNDLDLHGRWCKSSDLLLHTVGDTWIHSGTTRLRELALGLAS